MKIEFNHTIVHCRDKQESANFVAELFGLPAPIPFHVFLVVQLTNGASIDFIETAEAFMPQHYAFLVGDVEFDQIFKKIQERRISYWADPGRKSPNMINNFFDGRGVYFEEPSGNFLEIITKTYDLGSFPAK